MAQITSDLDALMDVFPSFIRQPLKEQTNLDDLIEVVMDLGRRPKAYFATTEIILSETPVTPADIDGVVSHIGEFMGDNRAGIERTLHRISAIRNRRGDIIGLTCRVGRAVYGTIDIVQDLLETEKSVLLLGRPGVGKTTLLREAARILAERKRVIVVDTSNEIAGDGDIPHPAIGKARRMQVPQPELQHQVMIEAVENHTPEVIIIDEIGRLAEAEAARTIAERGVQLIGTAHGRTLDNLLVNPTLADLVGGIDSVTLSDEEARRRNTQKSVLERRSPPTFDILVEIQDRHQLAVHHDVARSVDDLLRGRLIQPEIRTRDAQGRVNIEPAKSASKPHLLKKQHSESRDPGAADTRPQSTAAQMSVISEWESGANDKEFTPETDEKNQLSRKQIYVYGVNKTRLREAANALHVPIEIVPQLPDADVVITLKSHYRKHPQPVVEAEERRIPLYILRANTIHQVEKCLIDIFQLSLADTDTLSVAIRETQEAIRRVLRGEKSIELAPQEAFIRRKQHRMARQSNLISQSRGKDPKRRVKIYRVSN